MAIEAPAATVTTTRRSGDHALAAPRGQDGRILIDKVIEYYRFTVFWDDSKPIQDWERETVGFDYTEAGAMLLQHWNFASNLCDIIRDQLKTNKVTRQDSLLSLLQFTLRFLPLTGCGFEKEEWALAEDDLFLKGTNLRNDDIKSLIVECKTTLNTIMESLDLS